MLKLAGFLLVVAGTLAGVALILGPFAALGFTPGLATWLLFPFGVLAGLLLMALGVERESLPTVLHAAGGILLALAGAAAIFLVLPAFGALGSSGGVASIWFVLVVATILGTLFLVTTGKGALKV
ncbi:MAG TPA: hypothetical protein VL084_01870 [Thermoanaerobaculia bacterium]|nr:hypothetical protein [Thermoanaerobaculia bacterium]